MPQKSSKEKSTDRVSIISAVKTYLGFFVLVVLIAEAVLGTLAFKAQGQIQLVALYGMLFVIVSLIAVVSFFAYNKPGALLRTIGSEDNGELQSQRDFVGRISGQWWERIKPDDPSAISLVEIHPDTATSAVKLKGRAYSKNGDLAAIWESIASCINSGERKIFYYWKGWHQSNPNEPFEGFGEVSFHESSSIIDSGVGFFSDTNLTDMKSTTKKFAEFRRCDDLDADVMTTGNSNSISEMIRRKLS